MPGARIRLQLMPTTPIAMGGARPDQRAELRGASFKSLLRWWYRAVDPEFKEHEGRLFGSLDDDGQRSLVQVRVARRFNQNEWDRNRYDGPPFTTGSGTNTQNGFKYLAYPWFMAGGTSRRWLDVSDKSKFWLDIGLHASLDTRDHQRVLAATWALLHLGSVGGRSRRGFGSLTCNDIGLTKGTIDLEGLSFPHAAPDLATYAAQIKTSLETIRGWLSGGKPPMHGTRVPAVGSDARVLIRSRGFPVAGQGGLVAWEAALKELGSTFQAFRSRRSPDYQTVKDTLVHASGDRSAAQMARAPQRAAFGLPLTFRYRSVRTNPSEIDFKPKDSNRWGSPLILRVVRLGDQLHPMAVRLSAPTPGASGVTASPKGGRAFDITEPSADALNDFCDSLASTGWRKIG